MSAVGWGPISSSNSGWLAARSSGAMAMSFPLGRGASLTAVSVEGSARVGGSDGVKGRAPSAVAGALRHSRQPR